MIAYNLSQKKGIDDDIKNDMDVVLGQVDKINDSIEKIRSNLTALSYD